MCLCSKFLIGNHSMNFRKKQSGKTMSIHGAMRGRSWVMKKAWVTAFPVFLSKNIFQGISNYFPKPTSLGLIATSHECQCCKTGDCNITGVGASTKRTIWPSTGSKKFESFFHSFIQLGSHHALGLRTIRQIRAFFNFWFLKAKRRMGNG